MASPEAGEEDSGSFEVATWRVVTLFLVIVAIDTGWEFFDEFLTNRLQSRMQMGLLHAWQALKFETMALGFISLLLVVGEEQLLKICINSKDTSAEYASDNSGAADEYTDHGSAAAPADTEHIDSHRRRLLASGGSNPCPYGQESVWQSELIHKAHVLIFLIAACHIIYAMMSISLTMLAMRRWQKFEEHVQDGVLLPLPLGGLQKQGEPNIVFGLRQCLRQFTHQLDVATFGALRALFVGRVNVGPEFNFAAMIQEYLTEEFARVLKFDVIMWGIAILWIAFPEGSYGGFWLTGIFMLLSVITGAKLTAVVMHLARLAYSAYYQPQDAAFTLPHNASDELRQSTPSLYEKGAAADGVLTVSGQKDDRVKNGEHLGSEEHLGQSALQQVATSARNAAGPVAESSGHSESTPGSDSDAPLSPSRHSSADPPPARSQLAFRRAVRGHSQRVKATSPDTPLESDTLLRLFWFRRPRLMLRVFRYAFFQNALALAVVMFGFWQDEKSIFGGAVAGYGSAVRIVAWLLLFFVLLLLVHTSMILFPLYALAAGTAEFGSPEGVLDFAKRRGIRPDLVKFLETTNPASKSTESTAPQRQPRHRARRAVLGTRRGSRAIPEDRSDDGSAEDEESLPPVVSESTHALALGAARDAGRNGGALGSLPDKEIMHSPHALSAASDGPACVGTGRSPGRANLVQGGSCPISGLGGVIAGRTAVPGDSTSSHIVPVQSVPLAHAYSDGGGMVPPPGEWHCPPPLNTPQTTAVEGALGVGDYELLSGAPACIGGHPAGPHAPGMANTVQGLLEGMAARRVHELTSRVKRPQR